MNLPENFTSSLATAINSLLNPSPALNPVAMGMLYPKALQIIAEGQAKQDIFRKLPPQTLTMPLDFQNKPHFLQYLPLTQPKCCLGDAALKLAGTDDFCGQAVAIIASWSGSGKIDPYVKYYARCLHNQGYQVILACGMQPLEAESLGQASWLSGLVYRTCAGYDFTSFKAVLEVFPSILQAKELLLTNDSIFAPLTPLAPIHAAMNSVPCDFWGLLASKDTLLHLQSYYLVFKPKVLQHKAWQEFWDSVDTKAEKFATVAKYEVMLTAWLASHDFIPGVFIPPLALPDTNLNPTHYFWRELITRFHFPVLKRDLWRHCQNHPHLAGASSLLQNLGYNPQLLHSCGFSLLN